MQKMFYLFVFLLLTGLIANAQIKQGQSLLGGDLSFFSLIQQQPVGSNYTSEETSLSLSPSFGKAIKDNLILGFDLSYFHTQSKNTDALGNQSNSNTDGYGVGVYLRQYKPLGKNFSVFMQERLGGSYQNTHNEGILDDRAFSVNLGFSPGVAYAICRRIQIETYFANVVSATYLHHKNGVDPNQSTDHSIAIGTNLSGNALGNLSFGFRFLLGS